MRRASGGDRAKVATLMGATLIAVAMLGFAPAWAADAPPQGGTHSLLRVHPPLHGWETPDDLSAVRAPLTAEQRQTMRVREMDRMLSAAHGAVFAGQDALGTGTSITH